MKENINTREYWDSVYAKELENDCFRRDSQCYGFIQDYLDQCLTFLDVGCGTGSFFEFLQRRDFPASVMCGVDISVEAARFCFEKHGVSVVQGDVSGGLGDVFEADCVSCFHVLEHLEHPYTVINDCYRVAKKYVIFAVPLQDGEWREHLHHWTLQDVKKMFAKFGNVSFFRNALSGHHNKYEIIVIIKKGR